MIIKTNIKSMNTIWSMEHSNYMIKTPIIDTNNKKAIEFLKNNDYDMSKFYKIQGKLYSYVYINKTVFVEIYNEISEEIFQMMNINRIINQHENAHKKCIESKDYDRLFSLMDKPFRLEWYEKLFDDIPDKDKYEIFRDIYGSSEYGFNNLSNDFIRKVFSYNKRRRYWLREYKRNDTIAIYRGEGNLSTSYCKAYSWTTDLDVARFFAMRFGDNGSIYKGNVRKSNILDFIENRNESEVIVFPENVFDIEKI